MTSVTNSNDQIKEEQVENALMSQSEESAAAENDNEQQVTQEIEETNEPKQDKEEAGAPHNQKGLKIKANAQIQLALDDEKTITSLEGILDSGSSTLQLPQDNYQTNTAVQLDEEKVLRDIRPTLQGDEPFIQTKKIYESYTPENTHLMREYMLHVILKNVVRMRKHKIITEAVLDKFNLVESYKTVPYHSNELREYLSQLKRENRLLNPEYLKFDSTIESGNLERVEAYPINNRMIEQQRAAKEIVVQKYNLFCKVDTNTKGHQQWFYFKVRNTKVSTRYQFSICNFTKPFSLFKQGMQIHLLSKKRQTEHIQNLEERIAAYDIKFAEEQLNQENIKKQAEEEDKANEGNAAYQVDPILKAQQDLIASPRSSQVTLDTEARLYKDHGIVREQWQSVGSKIEYVKSKLQRTGWNVPGPLNLDDEEEDNVWQDDLNQTQNQNQNTEQSGVRYKRYFYQMNFELEFQHDDDTIYLAYSRPYQYSQIIAHMFHVENKLSAIIENPKSPSSSRDDKNQESQRRFSLKISRPGLEYKRDLLCTTICGLPVPKITITANRKSQVPSTVSFNKRKTIIVTARVHPGETNASTVFEGFLDQLTENVEQSAVLANFIVRLVPCMNPDGVVCGNYRSSLAGVDLNRQWILPSKELHPEVYYTKALMHQITKVENKKILIYCDIHCHSKKKNSFLYGCNIAKEGAAFSTWTQVRLLPRLLAHRSKYISLPSCRFGIEACKVGTARVVVWKEFQVMNSFTLENSFFGYDYGLPMTKLYTQDIYREIGGSFAHTLNDYRSCIEQMKTEMVQSKGWLKPMRLKEVSGQPAAEVIANEIMEEKQKKKRARYIKKYHARMKKLKKNGYSFGGVAPTSAGKNKSKEIVKEQAIEEEVDEKPVKKQINDPISASLLQPIKNKPRRIVPKEDRVVGFTRASPYVDEDGEQDFVAKMPHMVSRSPRAVGKINIINLAIGAQISKPEETAAVDAIRAQQMAQQIEQARLQELDIAENDYLGIIVDEKKQEKNNNISSYNTTLLGEAEIKDREKARGTKNEFSCKEALMRGQFGKPLIERQFDSSMLLNKQENPQQKQVDVQESKPSSDAGQSFSDNHELGSDEQGEFYGGVSVLSDENENENYNTDQDGPDLEEDIDQDADKLFNNPMNVQNWRSLFNQDELNRAYQKSMQGFGLQVHVKATPNKETPNRDIASLLNQKQSCLSKEKNTQNSNTEVTPGKKFELAVDGQNVLRQPGEQNHAELDDEIEHIISLPSPLPSSDPGSENGGSGGNGTKMMRAVKEEEQNFSSNDDSCDGGSDDNLQDHDLYSKVYLKEVQSIEEVMRRTTRAQKNFIQEVQVMIKKKPDLPLKNYYKPSKKDYFREMAVEAFKKVAHVPASGSPRGMADVVSFTQKAAQSLSLTGVTLQNPKRDFKPALPPSKLLVIGGRDPVLAQTADSQMIAASSREKAVNLQQILQTTKIPVKQKPKNSMQLVFPKTISDRYQLANNQQVIKQEDNESEEDGVGALNFTNITTTSKKNKRVLVNKIKNRGPNQENKVTSDQIQIASQKAEDDTSKHNLVIQVTQKSNSNAIEAKILVNDFTAPGMKIAGRESPSDLDPGSALLEAMSPTPVLSPKLKKKQNYLAQMQKNMQQKNSIKIKQVKLGPQGLQNSSQITNKDKDVNNASQEPEQKLVTKKDSNVVGLSEYVMITPGKQQQSNVLQQVSSSKRSQVELLQSNIGKLHKGNINNRQQLSNGGPIVTINKAQLNQTSLQQYRVRVPPQSKGQQVNNLDMMQVSSNEARVVERPPPLVIEPLPPVVSKFNWNGSGPDGGLQSPIAINAKQIVSKYQPIALSSHKRQSISKFQRKNLASLDKVAKATILETDNLVIATTDLRYSQTRNNQEDKFQQQIINQIEQEEQSADNVVQGRSSELSQFVNSHFNTVKINDKSKVGIISSKRRGPPNNRSGSTSLLKDGEEAPSPTNSNDLILMRQRSSQQKIQLLPTTSNGRISSFNRASESRGQSPFQYQTSFPTPAFKPNDHVVSTTVNTPIPRLNLSTNRTTARVTNETAIDQQQSIIQPVSKRGGQGKLKQSQPQYPNKKKRLMPFSRRASNREIAQYAAAAQHAIEQKNYRTNELDRPHDDSNKQGSLFGQVLHSNPNLPKKSQNYGRAGAADHIQSDSITLSDHRLRQKQLIRGSIPGTLQTPNNTSSGEQQMHVEKDRRRSDHFQAYLAINIHSMSNEVLKKSYEKQLKSSRGSKNERSGSLGAVSASNAEYNNFNGQGDYGNPIFELNENSQNNLNAYSSNQNSSAIESESFQLKQDQGGSKRASPMLAVRRNNAVVGQRHVSNQSTSLNLTALVNSQNNELSAGHKISMAVDQFLEVPMHTEVRNVQDSAYQASLQRLQNIAKFQYGLEPVGNRTTGLLSDSQQSYQLNQHQFARMNQAYQIDQTRQQVTGNKNQRNNQSLDVKHTLPEIKRTIGQQNWTVGDPRTKSISVRQQTAIREKQMTNASYVMSQEDFDQDEQVVGCLEDQKSLALLNMLQSVNSAIQPSPIRKNRKRQQQYQQLENQSPSVLMSKGSTTRQNYRETSSKNQGHRLKLKSLLNEAPPQTQHQSVSPKVQFNQQASDQQASVIFNAYNQTSSLPCDSGLVNGVINMDHFTKEDTMLQNNRQSQGKGERLPLLTPAVRKNSTVRSPHQSVQMQQMMIINSHASTSQRKLQRVNSISKKTTLQNQNKRQLPSIEHHV